MFMMPTPPTTSEIIATYKSSFGDQLRRRAHGLGDLRHVADGEIVRLGGAEVVAFAEHVVICWMAKGICAARPRVGQDLVHVGKPDRLRHVGQLVGRRNGVEARAGCSDRFG